MNATVGMLDTVVEAVGLTLRQIALFENELAQRELGLDDVEEFIRAIRSMAQN